MSPNIQGPAGGPWELFQDAVRLGPERLGPQSPRRRKRQDCTAVQHVWTHPSPLSCPNRLRLLEGENGLRAWWLSRSCPSRPSVAPPAFQGPAPLRAEAPSRALDEGRGHPVTPPGCRDRAGQSLIVPVTPAHSG